MPYTSMPAWPNLSDQEVSELAYFIKTLLPRLRESRERAQAGAASERAERHERVDRAREEALRRDRLRQVPRHARTRRRTFGADAGGRLGHPIRPADLAQSWTFRGGASREDIFRTMSTGFNGTPMPGFVDALTPEQRWAITDYIVSLSGSSGPGYTNLVVAKHVLDPIDLAKGAANFASAPVGPFSGRRADHGARTRVPSSHDLGNRSGDLRRRVDRLPRSLARHERGEDGTERTDTSRSSGGGGVGPERCGPGRRGPLRRGGGAGRGAATGKGSVRRGGSGARRPAIRVLGRSVDPDSVAGADQRPQALLHLRRPPELGGSLVLRSGPPRSPSVHRPGQHRRRGQ